MTGTRRFEYILNCLRRGKGADYSGCSFAGANVNVSGRCLPVKGGKNFQSSSLDSLSFTGEMQGCNLNNASFERCAFRCCDMQNADFRTAALTFCRFKSCSLQGAVFANAVLAGDTEFSSSSMMNSVFSSSKFVFDQTWPSFNSCNLTGSNFIDADLGGTEFRHCQGAPNQ